MGYLLRFPFHGATIMFKMEPSSLEPSVCLFFVFYFAFFGGRGRGGACSSSIRRLRLRVESYPFLEDHGTFIECGQEVKLSVLI